MLPDGATHRNGLVHDRETSSVFVRWTWWHLLWWLTSRQRSAAGMVERDGGLLDDDVTVAGGWFMIKAPLRSLLFASQIQDTLLPMYKLSPPFFRLFFGE